LSDIFPLDPKPDGMRVLYPVLIDDRTILTPNAVLRFVYNKPGANGQPGGPMKVSQAEASSEDQSEAAPSQGHHHHGGGLNPGAFASGSGQGSPSDQSADDGEPDGSAQHPTKNHSGAYGNLEINNTVWVDKYLYVEALDNASENSTVIIYSFPPDPKPLSATINFPGGILLGEVNAHVQVLGLNETSPAYLAGVRPGDEVQSIANSPSSPVTTLNDFARIYAMAKQQAVAAGQTSVSINFSIAKDGSTITTEIDLPVSS
jgi:hypothetical protein